MYPVCGSLRQGLRSCQGGRNLDRRSWVVQRLLPARPRVRSCVESNPLHCLQGFALLPVPVIIVATSNVKPSLDGVRSSRSNCEGSFDISSATSILDPFFPG